MRIRRMVVVAVVVAAVVGIGVNVDVDVDVDVDVEGRCVLRRRSSWEIGDFVELEKNASQHIIIPYTYQLGLTAT
jgi:hypothetical protein